MIQVLSVPQLITHTVKHLLNENEHFLMAKLKGTYVVKCSNFQFLSEENERCDDYACMYILILEFAN